MHEYDNRYLWMNLKRIISSHFANYREAWEANELVNRGLIHPTLSKTYPLDEVGPGGPRRPPERPPGQGRRAHARRPSRGSASPTRSSAPRFLSEINRFSDQ